MTMKTLACLTLLLGAITPLCALEFRVLSWDGDITGLKFRAGPDIVEIAVGDEMLSIPYVSPDAPPRFFRETRVNDELVRTPVATPPPPDGLERGILLLAAGPDANTFLGGWLDDTPENAPPGTVRFYNHTRLPLAVKTPGDQWLQAPGDVRRVAFDTARRALPIQVAAQTDGEWTRVANVSQPVRPHHRLLVFLRDARPSPDGRQELIDLRVFYDQ